MFSVALCPLLIDDGLNDAVAPEGKPLTLRVTVSALPELTAVEI
jgi:hypothetical protein